MQIHRLSYRVKGFVRLANYAIRWTRMVTEQAKHKLKVLAFWQNYGLEATKSAYGVSERTLYYWRAKLKEGGGQSEALNNEPRRPKTVRKRQWSDQIKSKIRELRNEHPNLGKEKLHIFLQAYCQANNLICPSVSTI